MSLRRKTWHKRKAQNQNSSQNTMVSSIPMQDYKRENSNNRQQNWNKERQNRARWREGTPCPMTLCRRYAIETRYQMQTSMTMSIFVCCGGRALWVSLLCAFDNFVRIMASRVSFVLWFVCSYLVRNENICGWEEVGLEVCKPGHASRRWSRHQSIVTNEQEGELRRRRRGMPHPKWEEVVSPMVELETHEGRWLPWNASYRRQYVSSSVPARRVGVWAMACRAIARVWVSVPRIRCLLCLVRRRMSFASVAYENRSLLYRMTLLTVCRAHVDTVLVVETSAHWVLFNNDVTHCESMNVWWIQKCSGVTKQEAGWRRREVIKELGIDGSDVIKYINEQTERGAWARKSKEWRRQSGRWCKRVICAVGYDCLMNELCGLTR